MPIPREELKRSTISFTTNSWYDSRTGDQMYAVRVRVETPRHARARSMFDGSYLAPSSIFEFSIPRGQRHLEVSEMQASDIGHSQTLLASAKQHLVRRYPELKALLIRGVR